MQLLTLLATPIDCPLTVRPGASVTSSVYSSPSREISIEYNGARLNASQPENDPEP